MVQARRSVLKVRTYVRWTEVRVGLVTSVVWCLM